MWQAFDPHLQDPVHNTEDSGSHFECAKTAAVARVSMHDCPKEAHHTAHRDGQYMSLAAQHDFLVYTLDRRHQVHAKVSETVRGRQAQ